MNYVIFGSTYGQLSYGTNSYQDSITSTTTDTTATTTGAIGSSAGGTVQSTGTKAFGGSLQNTGLDIIVPIIVSISLIVAALILLIRRNPNKEK